MCNCKHDSCPSYYKKKHLNYNQNDLVPSDSGIQMKEKEMKEEKAKPLPAVNPLTSSVEGI